MYILQISDLHVSAIEEIEALKSKIRHLGTCLINCIPEGSQIICCLLGDFVEKGNASLFPAVKELLAELHHELCRITDKENIALIMIPGNHDLCSNSTTDKKTLNPFNEFASEVLNEKILFSDTCSILEADYFGYHLISISTVLNSEHRFGSIDYHQLHKCRFPANTILLTHHSLMCLSIRNCIKRAPKSTVPGQHRFGF